MIAFSRAGFDAVVDHALEAAPYEACGVLGGSFGRTSSRIEQVEPAANAAASPEVEYALDPGEQFELMEAIREGGREVVGFYHSHPVGPPGPSQADARRATWPDYSYVIAVLDGHPFVGSWRWNEGSSRFAQELVRLV